MVLTISQETFDEVVKENIEEFSMTPEEAVKDAVEQFKAQGVDLSTVITDMAQPILEGELVETLQRLSDLIKVKPPAEDNIQKCLDIIKTTCDKDVAHRILAGNNGAYNILIDVLDSFESNICINLKALAAITSLMTGQPDLLTSFGVKVMMKYLEDQKDTAILQQLLKWARQCCILHETNRQTIFSSGIVPKLKALLEFEGVSAPTVRCVCGVLRALVLDDDVRVEYGKAHEHARGIAEETLCPLTNLLKKFKGEEETVGTLLVTLAALVVRNDYCQKVDDVGGLVNIMNAMIDFPASEQVNRQAFKLLKALAGNDDVKAHIVNPGNAPVIIAALKRHKTSPDLVVSSFGCIAALTLRNPTNSKVLCASGAHSAIVEAMKLHKKNPVVQKQGSWAIRNIVSRDRSLSKGFLQLGIESILREALMAHTSKLDYDVKSALRDLGCEVELKERWTGKGGALSKH